METSKNIWVTHSFIGYHRWKDAPDEVSFLRDMHRHRFHIRLSISVNTNDRELEFFIIQRQLKKFCDRIYEGKKDIGSCEMIGENILGHFLDFYPERLIEVDVSEDWENGAQVKSI